MAEKIEYYDRYPGMSDREFRTMLAGLRCWQAYLLANGVSIVPNIAGRLYEIIGDSPLNIAELNRLCERLSGDATEPARSPGPPTRRLFPDGDLGSG